VDFRVFGAFRELAGVWFGIMPVAVVLRVVVCFLYVVLNLRF